MPFGTIRSPFVHKMIGFCSHRHRSGSTLDRASSKLHRFKFKAASARFCKQQNQIYIFASGHQATQTNNYIYICMWALTVHLLWAGSVPLFFRWALARHRPAVHCFCFGLDCFGSAFVLVWVFFGISLLRFLSVLLWSRSLNYFSGGHSLGISLLWIASGSDSTAVLKKGVQNIIGQFQN